MNEASRLEDGGDPIATGEFTLRGLRDRIAREAKLLAALRADAAELAQRPRAASTPIIGVPYLAGLVFGFPFWTLVLMAQNRWFR